MNLMQFIFGHSAGSETELQLATARRVLEQLLHSSSQGRGIGALLSYLDLFPAPAKTENGSQSADEAIFAAVMDNAKASRDWLASLENAFTALTAPILLKRIPGAALTGKINQVIAENYETSRIRQHILAVEFGTYPGVVLSDLDAFGDVLHELFINALKYSPEKSLIRIAAGFSAGRYELTIVNECDAQPSTRGVSDKKPAKLLVKPFFKAANQIDDRYAGCRYGIGIGLTIAEYQARQMNGALEIFQNDDLSDGAARQLTVRLVLPALD